MENLNVMFQMLQAVSRETRLTSIPTLAYILLYPYDPVYNGV